MGRWAKNHDQRKGQWLINAIRSDKTFPKIDYKKLGLEEGSNREKSIIELRLWDMTNEEFESIMEKYYE